MWDREPVIKAALGEDSADIAIYNGKIINVDTLEILEGYSILIKNGYFAYVGKSIPEGSCSKNTIKIDAKGSYISPGLIEAHTHIAYYFSIDEFVRYALAAGTTTVITETSEPGNALGKEGVDIFLSMTKSMPLKIFITTPCFAPLFDALETSNAPTVDQTISFFSNQRVLGVGEAYWPKVIKPDSRTAKLFEAAENYGIKLQGHSAGARGNRLDAYFASGISSCHEPITTEEVIERLRRGIHVILREGSNRHDLATASPVKEMISDFRLLSASTDGINARDLTKGHLNRIIERLIELGWNPLIAIQMLTLNAAAVFNLDDKMGSIAPGKIADLCIVDDLSRFNPKIVISNGKPVAKDGKITIDMKRVCYPKTFYNSMKLKRLKRSDFRFPTGKAGSIVLSKEFVTIYKQIDTDNLPGDTLFYAVFDRYGNGNAAYSYLIGTGITTGAFATTLNWDCFQLSVFGKTIDDIIAAANRVIEAGGGIAIAEKGKIIAEIPLPIGGIISDLPLGELAEKEKEAEDALFSIGCKIKNPLTRFQTLSFTGLPFAKLTDKGLIDVKNKQFIDH